MTKRALAGLLFAPLIGALLYSLTGLATLSFPGGFTEFLVTIAVAYLFAASGILLLALPAYLILDRFGLVRWWSALVAGALLGVLYASLIGPDSFSSPLLRGHFPLALIGALSGLAFWFVRVVTPPNNRWRGP